MDDLFSIGELSKYQNISKQTLIFYDKIGLFCPAYVNPTNGYRYYSAKQIDYLDTILIMKKIGFSLSEIREYLRECNTKSSMAALKRQLSSIDRRIDELRLLRSRVAHRCAQMETALVCCGSSPIQIENIEEQYILTQSVNPPYTLKEISIATKKCFAQGFQLQLPIFFQCGVIVPLSCIRDGRFTEASDAFLPIEQTDKISNIACIPSGEYVCIYHIGDYLSIGHSYESILNFCDTHGFQILSNSYEFCINDYITSTDENEYITKIMLQVSHKKG